MQLCGSPVLFHTASEVTAVMIITNDERDSTFVFVMQPIDFLLQQKPCKRWKQSIWDYWLGQLRPGAPLLLSVFLPRSILWFLSVGQQTGQKVRELICAKTLRILSTPPPFFLPLSLSCVYILDLLMRISCSQIPSALLALFMRK